MNFAQLFRHEEDPLEFKNGGVIIERGSVSKTFYVILEGSVKLHYKDQVLATKSAGDVFA